MATQTKIPKGTIEIKITLRGDPAGVVHALAHGLPVEALEGIRDGMTEELAKRQQQPRRGRRRVSITVTNERKRKATKP